MEHAEQWDDDGSMVGVYLTADADPDAVAEAVGEWFHETQHVPATGTVPAHVVGWAPRREQLSTRHRALIALAVYDAGAREVWLLTHDGEVLLPRLLMSDKTASGS